MKRSVDEMMMMKASPSVSPLRTSDTRRRVVRRLRADTALARTAWRLAQQRTAASVIQRYWRGRFRWFTTRRIVAAFASKGPTAEHVMAISFESLVVFLREKLTLRLTRECLQRIHMLAICRHGPLTTQNGLLPENVSVRVFLAGFMIVYRPTHVFESMGALEKALFDAAVPLFRAFGSVCASIRTSGDVPHELTQDFQRLLFEYLKRFKAWKVPDEAKLTARIKHALIALYQAEAQLPLDEPEDSPLRGEFRTQIERLRSKLLQISGEEAVRVFDANRRVNPQAALSGGGDAYASVPGRMTNEQLAHELLIDPTFQLDESGGLGVENPVFHRIRETFHQAFWDSLVDDMQLETPAYTRVFRVLAEVRDGLKDLCGARDSVNRVSEVIDIDFIKQRVESGAFDADAAFALLTSAAGIVRELQSPSRDQETSAKWAECVAKRSEAGVSVGRWFCFGLEFLLGRVNAMRIDAANSRLRIIAPVIRDHGVEYERGKFQDKLDSGALTLERTRRWLKGAVARSVAVYQRASIEDLLGGSERGFLGVHTEAMVGLVVDVPGTLSPSDCPETLLADVHRINQMRREFKDGVARVSLLVTARHEIANAARGKAPEQVRAVVDTVARAIARPLENMDALLAEVCDIVVSEPLLVEAAEGVVGTLRRCTQADNQVYGLMVRRVRELVVRMVEDGPFTEHPAVVRVRSVVEPVFPRIRDMAGRLRTLAHINRTVHVANYNSVIESEAQALAAG